MLFSFVTGWPPPQWGHAPPNRRSIRGGDVRTAGGGSTTAVRGLCAATGGQARGFQRDAYTRLAAIHAGNVTYMLVRVIRQCRL